MKELQQLEQLLDKANRSGAFSLVESMTAANILSKLYNEAEMRNELPKMSPVKEDPADGVLVADKGPELQPKNKGK